MKTSNKLLIGLIAFILLLATIFVGILKYYQLPEEARVGNVPHSIQSQMETSATKLVYFPITLILPILK